VTKLYLPDEKVQLKIDDITVSIQQLTMAQKATIIEKLQNTTSTLSLIEASQLAIKYGIKDIQGVELSDGKSYRLEFEGHVLTDSCVEALLCLPQSDKLQSVCFSLLKGISDPLVDASGKKIPGVEMIKSDKAQKRTKN
jgi:hypothetical protein